MEEKLETGKVFIDKEVVDWSQYTTMDSTQEDTPTCGIGENFDKSNEAEVGNSKIQQVQSQIENHVEIPDENSNEKFEDSKNIVDVSMEQNHIEVQNQEGSFINKDEAINDEESKSDDEKNSDEGITAVEVGRKDFNSSIVSTRKGTGTRLRRAEHQSGVPGVYWQESSQRWIAQWSDSISGRRITHGFSARVYGFEDAKQMAIKSRVDAIENGKATARKLHETSLTGKVYLNMNKSCYAGGGHQSETGLSASIGSHSHIGGIKGMRIAKYGTSEYERPEYLLKDDRSIVTSLMEKKNIQKIMNDMSDEGIGLLMEEMKHLKEDAEYEGIFWHPINKVWIGVWLDSITHETCTQSFAYEIGEDGIDISRLKAIEWRVKLINEKKLRDNVVEYVNNKEFKYHNNHSGSSGITNSCFNIFNNFGNSGIINPLNTDCNGNNHHGNSSSSLINLNGSSFSALNGLSNNHNSTEGSHPIIVQNNNYQLLLSQLMQYLYGGNNNSNNNNINNNNNNNTGTNNSSYNGLIGTNNSNFGANTGNFGTINTVTDYNNMILSNMLLLNGALNGSRPSSINNTNNMNVNLNSMISNYLNSYYGNLLKHQFFSDNSEGFTTKNNSTNNINGNCNNSPSLNMLDSVDFNYLSPLQILNDSTLEGMTKNKMMNSLLLGNGVGGYFGNYSSLNTNLANILGINQTNGAINSILNSGNNYINYPSNCQNQYMYNILQNLMGSNKSVPTSGNNNNNFGSLSLDNLDQFQNISGNLTENILMNHLNQTQNQYQNKSQFQIQPQCQQNNNGNNTNTNIDINGMLKKIISQENGILVPRSDTNMFEVVNLEKIDSLREEMMNYNQSMSNLLTSFEPLISGDSSFNNNSNNNSNNNNINIENNMNIANENFLKSGANNITNSISDGNINIIENNFRSNGDITDNLMDEKKISRSVTSSSVDSSISSNSTSFSMMKDSTNILEISESAATVSSTPASSSSSKMKAITSPKKKNMGGISYKSGIPGVYWKTRDQEWVAEWYDQNRKRHSRHFYVKKYGFNEAKKLAIQCRLNAVNSGEAVLRSGGNNTNNMSISGHNTNSTSVANLSSKVKDDTSTNLNMNVRKEERGERMKDGGDCINNASNQSMSPNISGEVETSKNVEDEPLNTNLNINTVTSGK
ncbi:AP2 domain protein [Cryptosporidium meleagridis]|uniref:AP2 domain protein n=1 Tax=Cryptosporidium meleagridis TaxID=93969 RepID=A0A2P4YZS0_9CRYT|nr:AP2 domain protein [Cryptosporidium meleagridis]